MNEKGSRWHLATPLSVCQSLHTDAACGLSRKAARSRFKKQGRNPLFDDVAPKRKSPIKSLLLDPALLLMLFSAILTILFLSPLQIVCTVVVCDKQSIFGNHTACTAKVQRDNGIGKGITGLLIINLI